MSDSSITRRQLEELMMSLSFNIHTNEDIQFLNQLYNNNQADMYIFRLTNTKKYFESIIIPYCKEHWKEIKEVISDENIKNEFILNFGEIPQMSQPQPSEIPQMSQPQLSEIPEQEINVQQTNDNENNNSSIDENGGNSEEDNKGCCSCCCLCLCRIVPGSRHREIRTTRQTPSQSSLTWRTISCGTGASTWMPQWQAQRQSQMSSSSSSSSSSRRMTVSITSSRNASRPQAGSAM